ncbi:hypothetical protein [Microbacterium sp. NIBRBAC000506063]|uniref:hypothetical protein n=1 Tax=Microbacterium sp. NIBRBAC000506063 TaxID=2734618 RepID=UPI002948BC4A|nr:hypothetical protein [Microbacterium sp. NIBRBAC000506063]
MYGAVRAVDGDLSYGRRPAGRGGHPAAEELGVAVDVDEPQAGRARRPGPETSTRLPRASSMLSPALSGRSRVRSVPSGSITTSSSVPFVRTATMRPSSSGRYQRLPRTHSPPPVSASAGATGIGFPSPRRRRKRFQRPLGSSAKSSSPVPVHSGCSAAVVAISTTSPVPSVRAMRRAAFSQGMWG